jgi:tetratricopeptide (TPR) repeat protein
VESIARPLRRLQEEASWFARAGEVRLLWLQTQAALRSTAWELSERLEYHADNQSPFMFLDAPWSGPDLGARARCTSFVEQFAKKLQAWRDAGLDVGSFDVTAPDHPTLESFAHLLRLACAVLRPPLCGLVVVLAPTRVDAGTAFLAEVSALVSVRVLPEVRWIVIEADTQYLAPLQQELGEDRALSVDFRIDEAEQRRDLAALAGPSPPAAVHPLPFPWGLWSSAGAMPQGAPPRRLDDPQPPTDDELRESGIEPAYLKGGAHQLRRLMLGAALALRQQRVQDALVLQAQSAELCGSLHMPREQVVQLLVLGGYQLAAAAPEAARQSYREAAALAARHQLALQHAQAELGLGMLEALQQRPEAITHYASAGRLSEQAEMVPLAIECWRMAGQCAADHGSTERAMECWQHALTLADTLAPDVQRTTSAADIARLLGNAQQARGDDALAEQQHRRAFQIEHGVAPGARLAVASPTEAGE